ncbi:MAG: transketolase C-terminal domain-containing protein [Candidatus Levybacteria bacterium]|nr:transketolase C-terminal domain-containing protein [Candidatus Levybacteria bacterium]
MRIAFVNTLFKLAKKDSRIILLTADLGYSVFEEFQEKLPDQFLNVGIAEQNMTGVAAGMAIEGMKPFIYSIVPFATMRNFEQIRNDICYQNLNVKIVGVGAGFSYGPYGHTHHGLEDVAILRPLPNMTIFTPGDPVETSLVTTEAVKMQGPAYIRLGRAGEPVVHTVAPQFKVGKGIVLQKGKKVALIAMSTMLASTIEVAKKLKEKNLTPTIVSIPTIKPFDNELILDIFKSHEYIYSLEEHFAVGGLGSAVAEAVVTSNVSFKKYHMFAAPDKFSKVIGDQRYMRNDNGLSVDQILKKIISDTS